MSASLSSSCKNHKELILIVIPPAELDNYLCHFILEIRKRLTESSMSLTPWQVSGTRLSDTIEACNNSINTHWLKAANLPNNVKYWRLNGKNSKEREKAENQMLLIHFQRKTEWNFFIKAGFLGSHNPQSLYKQPFCWIILFTLAWEVARNTIIWNEATWLRKQRSMAKSTC